jgi:hypothetical protein
MYWPAGIVGFAPCPCHHTDAAAFQDHVAAAQLPLHGDCRARALPRNESARQSAGSRCNNRGIHRHADETWLLQTWLRTAQEVAMKRASRSTTISYAAGSKISRGTRLTLAIVYYLMVSTFLVVACATAVSTYQGLRSHSFIQTSGVVTERFVKRRNWRPGIKGHMRNRVYSLDVVYTYDFQGITYVNDQIEAGTLGLVHGQVLRRFGSRLEVGRTVPVYVDPSDHRNAVLERGLSSMTTMLYFLLGFFGFVTLFLRVLHVGSSTEGQPAQRPGARDGATVVQR